MQRVSNSQTQTPPYNAIGLLETAFSDGSIGYGSGALIDSRNVLTCAHNLIDQETSAQAESVRFYPAWNGGHDAGDPDPSYGGTADSWPSGADQAQALQVSCAFYLNGYQTGQDGLDLGLVRLTEPAATSSGYFFVPQEVTDTSLVDVDVNLCGYPGDQGGGMWWDQDQVAYMDLSNNVLGYTHDTYNGDSGAPVYIYDSVSDEIRVYAVHTLRQSDGTKMGVLLGQQVWVRLQSALQTSCTGLFLQAI